MIVTGGGTGGHTYPALTAVRGLRSRLEADGAALDVLWTGKDGGLEQRVAQAEGIRFAAVATGKIRRASNPLKMISAANVRDIGRVPLGVVQARALVARFRPDVVLATGGYVAVPVGLAARLCRRPLVVHEQTVRLGLTNRLLARIATSVAVSSESTLELLPRGVRAVVTGNPVRPELLHGRADRAVRALGLSGFAPELPTVYVTGGAQGSRQINQLVCRSAPWLLQHANIVHQCGKNNAAQLREQFAQLPEELASRCIVTEFVGSELADVFALADLVISRSGAGTIAELTALGKPSVLVPLPSSAGNEQVHNARNLHDAGAAVALPSEVSEADLRAAVTPLLTDRNRRLDMARRARAHSKPDAADRLVDAMLAAAAHKR
ncbi:UDP-N-acetylglucosamine--N-acetylmuramyl-(pentapeptide) pyrophosphoryl-undecaprenol N-acetylglucosamine transferase [Amycolatopsis sp. NPDC004079]|uniref:UDP-N-acetylglucosamine--N-acetylmuramyl- (pentapeptide) pyrophosphoryl-undecaprenol N-acetylglucosamine transferase n=1 Tax=Amycolatopsis sp. NPDC004079 TaxID=3154549 RepID=UPI0033BE6014